MTKTHLKRAVVYLRVSTDKQTHRDGATDEGYSLPAQREACYRKAETLDAEVVAEYVDPGYSATSTKRRAGLKQLLAEVKEQGGIDFVVIHKVNRWARNRIDDAELLVAVESMGATLVSASENIDKTPAGRLLHGVLATIAEYESLNLSQEIRVKTLQKVKLGGTPGLAPLGYVNVRKIIDGHEVRTVEIDPKRAPIMQWAFLAYASGNYTITSLWREALHRGLTTRPGPKRPAKPIVRSAFAKLLSNPYYIGLIRFKGVEHPGRHQPLIPEATFQRVQEMLKTNQTGEKVQHHPHYLKGTIYCPRCFSRYSFTLAKGNGGAYPYFFCRGRQEGNGCNQPYLPADTVEDKIIHLYKTQQLEPGVAAKLRRAFMTWTQHEHRRVEAEATRQRQRLEDLHQQRRKLLDLHYREAIPIDLFEEEQSRITQQVRAANAAIEDAGTEWNDYQAALNDLFELAPNLGRTYREANDQMRRRINRAIYSKILVDAEQPVSAILASPPERKRSLRLMKNALRVIPKTEGALALATLESTNPALVSVGPGSNIVTLVVLTDRCANRFLDRGFLTVP